MKIIFVYFLLQFGVTYLDLTYNEHNFVYFLLQLGVTYSYTYSDLHLDISYTEHYFRLLSFTIRRDLQSRHMRPMKQGHVDVVTISFGCLCVKCDQEQAGDIHTYI